MKEALFRIEAMEAGRSRLSGTVIASVPPSSRVFSAVLLALVGAVVLFLIFGSYASGAAVPGAVEYDRGIVRVHAPAAGEVRALHVRLGQRVPAGAPLVTVGMAQGPHGLAEQIADLGVQIDEIDHQFALTQSTAAADRTGFEQQRATAAQTIASIERQRGIGAAQIALAERTLGRTGRLAREGAGSVRQEEEARADLLARRASQESLGERLIAARASLADAQNKLARVAIGTAGARSDLVSRRASLLAQADALRRADALVIAAPAAGVVADLPVQPGQRIAADASVVTLLPRDGVLEVHLYAPSRAIGFVHVGQPVRLRFDAFPYQKYGAARGTVVAVSPVAIDPATSNPPPGINEPVFRVKVRVTAAPGLPALRPGMTVSADLLLAPRPLWALLLGPIREASAR